MKVLHALGWYFPESIGGTEVYVAALAGRQRAQGIETVIAAPDAAARATREIEWDGARVFRYPTLSARPDFDAFVTKLRPDVVHVHSIVTGLGLDQIAAARRTAAQVIFTAHLPALGFICQRGTLQRWGTDVCDGAVDPAGCAACVLQSRGLSRNVATVLARIGHASGRVTDLVPGRLGTGLRMPRLIADNRGRQQALFDLIDAFVVLNERAREIVLANGAPPAKVVLNQLGTSVPVGSKTGPAATPTRSPVRVGFVGRLHEVKGIDVLLRAFAALPHDAAITLEIVGPMGADDGRAMEEMLRTAATADRRIVVSGALDRAAVEATLRRIDVLCCPSISFENGPTIALEAQAVGTPVIGSRLGAIPEIVTDGLNGRVLPPGDWRGLADALGEIAAHPAVVDRWRTALPRPRTMDDVADDYLALYGTPEASAARG